MTRKIEFIVERTNTGYSAYADKYPVFTTGSTLKEVKANMLEALNLHFEEQGKVFTEAHLKVTLDIPQFFEFYKVINAKALSERIHMNQSLLAQYIKGTKQPSEKQVQRILSGVHQLGKELSEIEFKI